MVQTLFNDKLLAKYARRIARGEYFFRQGEKGTVMYFILSGEVCIFYQGTKSEHLAQILGSGQAFGEEGVLTAPHGVRSYTAQARSPVSVLELGAPEIQQVQTKMPDFQLKLIRLLSERVQMSLNLINVLQAQEPLERVVLFLVHLAKYAKKNTKVSFHKLDLVAFLNLPLDKIDDVLEEFCLQKVISKAGSESEYVIDVPESLMDHLTDIKKFFAA